MQKRISKVFDKSINEIIFLNYKDHRQIEKLVKFIFDIISEGLYSVDYQEWRKMMSIVGNETYDYDYNHIKELFIDILIDFDDMDKEWGKIVNELERNKVSSNSFIYNRNFHTASREVINLFLHDGLFSLKWSREQYIESNLPYPFMPIETFEIDGGYFYLFFDDIRSNSWYLVQEEICNSFNLKIIKNKNITFDNLDVDIVNWIKKDFTKIIQKKIVELKTEPKYLIGYKINEIISSIATGLDRYSYNHRKQEIFLSYTDPRIKENSILFDKLSFEYIEFAEKLVAIQNTL